MHLPSSFLGRWSAALLLVSALMGTAPVSGEEPLPKDLRTRTFGSDWPQFLGPHRDSKSPEVGIRTDWEGEPGLPIVWQRSLGNGYGMPTISRGRLFQADRVGDRVRLSCLRSETGEELWTAEYPTSYEDLYGYENGPRCSPIVDGERVYLLGVEGKLLCYLVEDGSLEWQRDLVEEFGVVQNFFGVGGTPIIEGDLLIAMVGGSPEGSPSISSGDVEPNGTAVVAFDKYSGKTKYKLGDDLASYASPQVVTIGDRRWGFVFARGGLIGFEPTTGTQDFYFPWRARVLESVNASTPVVVGNQVFISETYGPGSALLEVEPGGYEVVWQDELRSRDKAMQTHWNTAVEHEGYLYGSSGRHTSNADLRCIDWKTGEVQWSVPRLTRCSLLYADGHLLCQTEYGPLLLIEATPEKYNAVAMLRLDEMRGDDGDRLLRYPCWSAPVLSHGLLYVRGDDRLVCFELIPPPKAN